jgi:hypothetical protein
MVAGMARRGPVAGVIHAAAACPLAHGPFAQARPVGELTLAQPGRDAQAQHQLGEGPRGEDGGGGHEGPA